MKGLAKCREKAGLTLRKLAAEMAVELNTVWRWEKGMRSPDVDTICRLAVILQCSTDDLINPPTAPVKPGELREKKAG